jgi:hypothetical protein
MSTRRKFIRDCAFVAAASSLVPTALAQNAFAPSAPPASPGYEQFLKQVNTFFRLRAGAESMDVVLAEANLLPASNPGALDAGNEKFSLLFSGPAATTIDQGIYALEHARLGRLSLFLVPVGSVRAASRHYEAIFNRPTNPADFAAQLSQAPKRSQKC